jgi:hypothetical protein
MLRAPFILSLVLAAAGAAALVPACASETPEPLGAAAGDAALEDSETSPNTDAIGFEIPDRFSDFPAAPIVDPSLGVPDGTSLPFADGAGPAPCLFDPEPGAVFPRNWLRPRFTWKADPGQDAFELRITIGNQERPLVVQTGATSWTMPAAMWSDVAAHSADLPISIELRAGKKDAGGIVAPSAVTRATIRIAPVEAAGSIVYWTTTSQSLKGFTVGDEGVADVLKPAQVEGRTVNCVGCHVSSPDGEFVGVSTKHQGGNASSPYALFVTPIKVGEQGSQPSWVGAGARTVLAEGFQGQPAFSAGHWKPTDRILVTAKHERNGATSGGSLRWIDLEASDPAKATGVLARNGDTGIPLFPTWSRDGSTIAYVSAGMMIDARAEKGPADLYTIPYAGKAGGTATKIPGASTAEFEENYPAFSPDDAFLTFTRVPAGEGMLFNAKKEVFVVPSKGGTAVRLEANDPPACTGEKSPGIWNSFSKWAPEASTDVDGNRYYWIVFSSKRLPATGEAGGSNRLYLTLFLVTKSGETRSSGAIYLWNQPNEDNHSPAWDVFRTPPVIK